MPKKNDPQSKPHYKGLTLKRARFVDEAVKQAVKNGDVNRSKAAAKVYDVKNIDVARSLGSKEFNRVDVRRAFLAEMERQGLTDELSIQTHTSAFHATKRRRDLETGEVWQEADHAIQLRAVQEYNKLKGYYAPITTQSAHLNLHAELTPAKLEEKEEELQEDIKSLEEHKGGS